MCGEGGGWGGGLGGNPPSAAAAGRFRLNRRNRDCAGICGAFS